MFEFGTQDISAATGGGFISIGGKGLGFGYNAEYGIGFYGFAQASVGIAGSAWGSINISFEHGLTRGGQVYGGVATPSGLPGPSFSIEKGLRDGSSFVTAGFKAGPIAKLGFFAEQPKAKQAQIEYAEALRGLVKAGVHWASTPIVLKEINKIHDDLKFITIKEYPALAPPDVGESGYNGGLGFIGSFDGFSYSPGTRAHEEGLNDDVSFNGGRSSPGAVSVSHDNGSSGFSYSAGTRAAEEGLSGGGGAGPKPIIIDLDGDGVELITQDESFVLFDWDDDGFAERSAWVGADDGFLMFDENNDGQITTAKEIAFAQRTTADDTDLEALAAVFDSNGDGKLNQLDTDFANFKIWQDINGNDLISGGAGYDGAFVETTTGAINVVLEDLGLEFFQSSDGNDTIAAMNSAKSNYLKGSFNSNQLVLMR